VTNCNAPAFL